MRVRCYLRYMDDFVLFSNRKQELLSARQRIGEFLAERLRLSMKPNGVWINRASHGLSFLGMRIFRGIIRVRPENRRRSLRRMRRTVKLWTSGRLAEEPMSRSLASIVAYLRCFCPNTPIELGTEAD